MSDDDKRPVLELRNATLAEVRFPDRTITLLAVPYERPTPADKPVIFRGEMFSETFARGAFAGIEERTEKIRVNREHRKGDTIGKVTRFDDTAEGLVAEIRVVPSPKGDEVLALASEDMVSPSIGFRVRPSDQEINRRSAPPTRYIRRAFIDHIALVEDPAYDSAEVLSVRGADEFVNAAHLPPLVTPAVDEWAAYLASRRAGASL
jgi:HK97 family phage prohead protease